MRNGARVACVRLFVGPPEKQAARINPARDYRDGVLRLRDRVHSTMGAVAHADAGVTVLIGLSACAHTPVRKYRDTLVLLSKRRNCPQWPEARRKHADCRMVHTGACCRSPVTRKMAVIRGGTSCTGGRNVGRRWVAVMPRCGRQRVRRGVETRRLEPEFAGPPSGSASRRFVRPP